MRCRPLPNGPVPRQTPRCRSLYCPQSLVRGITPHLCLTRCIIVISRFVVAADGTAGSCRVSFRFPDGRKALRRFLVSDPVDVLFRFVGGIMVSPTGAPSLETFTDKFELTVPTQPSLKLSAMRSRSVQEAGVANSLLFVRPLN
jgi:hypothetical protein